MRRLALVVGICGVVIACSGCLSLTRAEREDLRILKEAGVSLDEPRLKSPTMAAVFNVLPGVGNFYLASGTEETEMWAIGGINVLFWPLSIIWGVPEAAIDAGTMNKREAIYYYMRTEKGRNELKDAQDRMDRLPPIRR
ncbi:MAG: hypothetical protein KAX19_12720 [Candidatus Brocadiae bacterium]|nr:hypothetical protein [Candidatus Brocadiia bacterium]